MTDVKIPMTIEGKLFYHSTTEGALRNIQSVQYRPLFMPEIIDARIAADDTSPLWMNGLTAMSVSVTGKTKGGKAVVVYAHVPHYFSNPENVANTVKAGLTNGAGPYDAVDFRRLLDLQDDKTVFVVDYSTLKTSVSGTIEVSEALKHPQVIPFLGGKERAEAYLEKHAKVVGDKIGIFHTDLAKKPLGSMLFVNDRYDSGFLGHLVEIGLKNYGPFVGVPVSTADAVKKTGSLDSAQFLGGSK
ncbi:hypothetical protein C4573_03560 [Candidatus Woesearchaeota archaeon]|nr:MAG: hypothetical protein C4573_03560 [Candidatus Woesearchaeota archaeon]